MASKESIDALSTQRASALKIHIEPVEIGEQAALISTIASVLKDIVSSYESFLLAEFTRIPEFKTAFESNAQVFDTIKQNLALRAVDLNFGSCDVLIAPTLSAETPELFNNTVKSWEREIFPIYRDDIFMADLGNTAVLERITEQYSPKQRAKIFGPIISTIGDGSKYKINVGTGSSTVKQLRRPAKELLQIYVPKTMPESITAPNEKDIIAYLKVRTNGDGGLDLSTKGIKQVYYTEETVKDTYPFRPDTLRYDNYVFILNTKLITEIVFEDGLFFIHCDELDATVWGESREGTEEAFAFNFYGLYLNYYLEDDENLSEGGQEVKSLLKNLIQSIIHP